MELSLLCPCFYYLSTKEYLWLRRLTFSLISHIQINCVLWVSETHRIRPLLTDVKITMVNMPDFGVEGCWKLRMIFIFPVKYTATLFYTSLKPREFQLLASALAGFWDSATSPMGEQTFCCLRNPHWAVLLKNPSSGWTLGQRDEAQPSLGSTNSCYLLLFPDCFTPNVQWESALRQTPMTQDILGCVVVSSERPGCCKASLGLNNAKSCKIKKKTFLSPPALPSFSSWCARDMLTDAFLLKAR